MNTATMFDRRWITRTERPSTKSPSRETPQRLPHLGHFGPVLAGLEDAAFVLGLIYLVPIAILALGLPVALAVRIVLALGESL